MVQYNQGNPGPGTFRLATPRLGPGIKQRLAHKRFLTGRR